MTVSIDINGVVAAVTRVIGTTQRPVALHEPRFVGAEREYVIECVDTGWVSSVGKFVDRFERDLERFCGTRHAIGVASGTAALQVAYRLAGASAGDEVLMPALTFIATANAAAHLGAQPHFLDANPVHLGVDVDRLQTHLATIAERRPDGLFNRRTGARMAALVTTHVFGHIGDVERLVGVCNEYGLPLIEDAAEALGSRRLGRHAGTFGSLGTLSFNGNKVVTTGGGGAILTDDPETARRAKHLTTTARVPHPWEYFHDEVGYNYRLPNINAALGCGQLEALPALLQTKAKLASAYAESFANVKGVRFFPSPPGSTSNNWLNAISIDSGTMEQRNAILNALHQSGIQARPIWQLMHRLPMYAGAPRMDLAIAEQLERSIINLPSSGFLLGEASAASRSHL